MIEYIANGIDAALDVCTWRVRGPEEVRERNEIALGYLYQGFRNAGRQLGRGLYNPIERMLIYEEASNGSLKLMDNQDLLEVVT